MSGGAHAQAAERVLATLNLDGSRRWLRPRFSPGPWARRRQVVAWLLIAAFLAIPHLRLNGKPPLLFDVLTRQFTVLGVTFLPTETLLLLLLVLSIFIGIFLFTALFGRVWCGWACPQTVWMEFVFRPLERLLEGGPSGSRALDAAGWRGHLAPRRLAKYGVYTLIAVVLGNTFLAYFVGTDRLAAWMQASPAAHPMPFAVMAITTGLVVFDFAYFREQTCLVACPYGRIQSALLDRQSLIVTYDPVRGEPRGHGATRTGLGDCVDCHACVATCPTGIDIRDGLQLECVHCTQCMDACDTIMTKLGRPTGLIRYGSRDGIEGKPVRRLRPRTVLYPAAMVVTLGLLVWNLRHRADAQVTILRGEGAAPFVEQEGGLVRNQLRLKLENRGDAPRTYRVALVAPAGAQLIAPENPVTVPANGRETAPLFVILPAAQFRGLGMVPLQLRITGPDGFDRTADFQLLGPR